MNLNPFFKSVVDQCPTQIIICNTDHEILYMNPAAAEGQMKSGGYSLVGKNLKNCHNPDSVEKIQKVVEWFKADKENNIMFTYRNEKKNKDVYMVALRDENGELIGYYERHEMRSYENAEPYGLLGK